MSLRYTKPLLLTLLAALSLVACGKSEQGNKAAVLPDSIRFSKMALYPEGVDYDAAGNRFLVTSLHEGIVGAVSSDGSYTPVFQNPAMVSAIGIRIDAARDRVLVCNSDPGASIHTKPESQRKLAGLAAFKLSTGELIKYIDLGGLADGGNHFCNDIALAADGTVYATDSFSPIIYKIDSDYNASILLQSDTFSGDGFNLNGIVVKGDYLIVAKSNDGLLFKVPLADPSNYSEVMMDQSLNGADGMVLMSDGSLAVITNANHKIYRLTTEDDWSSAKISASAEVAAEFPTTGVEVNGALYVLHASLNVLFNPATEQHVETFSINKVNFQ